MDRKIMGEQFDMKEMFELKNRLNKDYGIKEYEIKEQHFDYHKQVENKKNFDFNTYKNKRKYKKIKIPKEKNKKFDKNPSPWNYDLELNWCNGYKNIKKKEKINKNYQKQKRKWLTSAKYERPKPDEPKKISDKVKKNFKKYTYIDNIIINNKKKDYPLPGPGSHFYDEKLIKKLKVENKDKFIQPKKQIKKYKYKQTKRLDHKEELKRAKSVGPGSYNPKFIDKTYKINNENFKKFKQKLKDKEEFKKEINNIEKNRLSELKSKLKFDTKEEFNPLPTQYCTFKKLELKNKIKRGTFKNGFGTSSRFPLSEKEKWDKKIKIYNKTSEKKISWKNDPQPAPNKYDWSNNWQGKKKIFGKNEKKKVFNLYNKITKGPVINNYYKNI